jgi:hypothetical protein
MLIATHWYYKYRKVVIAMDVFGNPERRGSSGRIPDSKRDKHQLYQRVNTTIEPSVFERLEKFCADEERARSWVIQKALDAYLSSRGY